MSTLWADLETRCDVPINYGTWAYAERAEILLFAYAIDDGFARVWDRAAGEPMPADLRTALESDCPIFVHNASFDRTVMLHCADTAVRTAAEQLDRWHCSMAKAYALALPGALDKLGDALGIEDDKRKLKTGKDLMRLFCLPPARNMKRDWATHETHPVEWQAFKDYATRDIEAMRECVAKLPSWNYKGAELALWRLDQKINARGIQVDLDFARAALTATDIAKEALASEATAATGGAMRATTQRDVLLKYLLAEHGIDLPDLRASTLERRAEDPDLPDAVRELIANRLSASTTSVAKYKKFLQSTSSDGRLRGTLQYCGAARTGRWAGRLVQLQNLSRPTIPQRLIEAGIDTAKASVEDLGLVIGDPGEVMKWASSAIRGALIASPGKRLVVADLASIEGRVTAWLAGEEHLLQAFRDYDAGEGPDLYILTYATAFNVDPSKIDKKSPERQIGKVLLLFMGFGGGAGAFTTGAATYGIDLDRMADQVYPSLAEWAINEAMDYLTYLYDGVEKRWAKSMAKLQRQHEGGEIDDAKLAEETAALDAKREEARNKARLGLAYKTFVACDAIKRMWRRAHPNIVSFWKDLEDTVRRAVNSPKTTFTCRKLKVRRSGSWLRIGLPSGRELVYPQIEVDDDGKISYVGVDQYTRNWQRIGTYGGRLVENVTQATARDQLAYSMFGVESEGFEIVSHAHDELITEAPLGHPYLDAERLSELMCARFPWNVGLPLAAEGFESERYRK